jgi:hypothetical protein
MRVRVVPQLEHRNLTAVTIQFQQPSFEVRGFTPCKQLVQGVQIERNGNALAIDDSPNVVLVGAPCRKA